MMTQHSLDRTVSISGGAQPSPLMLLLNPDDHKSWLLMELSHPAFTDVFS